MTAVVCVFCSLQGFSPIDALGPKQVFFSQAITTYFACTYSPKMLKLRRCNYGALAKNQSKLD